MKELFKYFRLTLFAATDRNGAKKLIKNLHTEMYILILNSNIIASFMIQT